MSYLYLDVSILKLLNAEQFYPLWCNIEERLKIVALKRPMTFIKTCWTFMSKLFVLPQMIYWLKKLVCMEQEQSRLAL